MVDEVLLELVDTDVVVLPHIDPPPARRLDELLLEPVDEVLLELVDGVLDELLLELVDEVLEEVPLELVDEVPLSLFSLIVFSTVIAGFANGEVQDGV